MTTDKDAGLVERDSCVGVLAALAAAISLLERTPNAKKAAPSDKMFATMLVDYKKALKAGRAALLSPRAVAGEPVAWRTSKGDGKGHFFIENIAIVPEAERKHYSPLYATSAPSGGDPATIEAAALIAENVRLHTGSMTQERDMANRILPRVARAIRALAAPVLTDNRG